MTSTFGGWKSKAKELTKDMTGVRVGMLVVQEPAQSHGQGARWWCVCDCGGRVAVGRKDLREAVQRGKSKNCGCLRRAREAAKVG